MAGTNPFLPPTPPNADQIKAQQLAALILRHNNKGQNSLQELIRLIKEQWTDLWENPQFTPSEILAAWGTTAAERFRVAGTPHANTK